MKDNVVYDLKPVIKALNDVDPDLRKAMIKDAKLVARPLASGIKRRINQITPLSGMTQGNGRLVWGAGRKADTVSIRFRAGRSRTRAVTPLVSLWITSPMTAIADVAGKGNFRKSKTVTREYAYKDGVRRHRISANQGRDFVRNLRSRNANDFVYPEVEKDIPDAEKQIKLVLNKYAAKVNRKLG